MAMDTPEQLRVRTAKLFGVEPEEILEIHKKADEPLTVKLKDGQVLAFELGVG